MKKILFSALTSFLLLATYIHFSTEIYVNKQSTEICHWLNKQSTDNPVVGPQAYEHPTKLKITNEKFTCHVVSWPEKYGYKYEMAIKIKSPSQPDMYLIYGLVTGGRHFLRPRYRQHSTKIQHKHQLI
jgi:hypothetical protein